ncbi:MAG: protein adenylyltransferase SelO [Vibrio sp.]
MSVWNRVDVTTRFSQLPPVFYTAVQPQPLIAPEWVMWNEDLALQFGLPPEPSEELLEVFAGQVVPDVCVPLAMKYAGHQFGMYNPDLGDGRGLLYGELRTLTGHYYDLHLKGSGLTPYSRMGDGRAVLRSSIREYLCSEAMAGLGIATTRALALVGSQTPVRRETMETGAMVARVAKTHIRFGHFEHLFYTNQLSELTLLADKVIEWYYPECRNADSPYAAMFTHIVERTACMIAEWQAAGFAHGVMNTDNMSILGETFDYGPFAFMDDYDPSLICNHSDYQGRYQFDRQPSIGLWNLTALAHALSPLIEHADLERILATYERTMQRRYSVIMREKLGLTQSRAEDSQLFDDLFQLMVANQVDYARFLRQLSNLDTTGIQPVVDLVMDREQAQQWVNRYLARCAAEDGDIEIEQAMQQRCASMRLKNPKYRLRNYLAQIAIDKAEQGDYSEVATLAYLLAHPFDEHPDYQHYAMLPPQWGKELAISCSS